MTTATAADPLGRRRAGERRACAPEYPRVRDGPTSTWVRTAGSGPGGTRWRPRWRDSGTSGLHRPALGELARLLRNEGATYNVDPRQPEPAAALVPRPGPWCWRRRSGLTLAAGGGPAGPAARSGLRRHLRRAPAGGRGAGPGRTRARPPGVPPGLRGDRRAGAHRHVPDRGGRGAGRDRRIPGHRGPGPGPLGPRLRPGQPHHPVEGPAQRSTGSRGSNAWPGSSGPSGPRWPPPPRTGWTNPGWSS